MVYKSKSICDVDHGYVVKDRSGMVVIGLSNDEMQASFKMTGLFRAILSGSDGVQRAPPQGHTKS